MANAVVKSEEVLTPEFRVGWANVFNKGKPNDQGKSYYELTALYPKGADLTVLKKIIAEVMVAKWGADKTKWPANWRNPLRDQGEVEREGYEPGAIFHRAKSGRRPGVVDPSAKNDLTEESEFYAGCYARAKISAIWYDEKGNRGVSLWFGNIQKTRDGDPLSGRASARDDFQPIAGAADDSAASLLD